MTSAVERRWPFVRRLAIMTSSLLTLGLLGLPGLAAPPAPLPSQVCQEPGGQTDTSPHPRVRRATVAGTPVAVVLPVGYDRERRRYPVVYLLHGAQGDEDSWIEYGGLLASTAGQPRRAQAIVVLPKSSVVTGFATDWLDGHRKDATFLSRTLVRWTDTHFRTVPDRRHRAIAGYSGGGLSAVHVAERFPQVFGAVGDLSGPTDLSDPISAPVTWATMLAQQACEGDDLLAPGPLGNPVLDREAWAEADPTRHVHRLRGMTVFVSSGNGVPCGAADLANLAYPTAATEPQMRRAATKLVAALRVAKVRHVSQARTCGLHWWTTWTPALADFWKLASARW